MVASACITFLFAMHGRLAMALPLINVVGVLGLIVALEWKLRRHAWFWITMTIIAALHVPLILFVPWGVRWVPAAAIAVIDSADFCAILAILSVVGNYMQRPEPAER